MTVRAGHGIPSAILKRSSVVVKTMQVYKVMTVCGEKDTILLQTNMSTVYLFTSPITYMYSFQHIYISR